MLNINYEFSKGFFFVRLSGHITRNNYNSFIKELNTIINKTGLKKIVINIDCLKSINVRCINNLLKYVKKLTYKGILVLLCDNNTRLKESVFKEIIPIVNYEQEVYNLI